MISNKLRGWIEVLLGDVTTESVVRHGSATTEYPVYGVDRTIGLTPEPKYVANNLSRYKLLLPGMFAYNPMRLNIGSIGYCSSKHEPGLVSPDYVVFQCNPALLNSEFLKYYIQSSSWREWTKGSGVGSVRLRIYYRELARMPILLPPISEQRAIAHILGTLDDKIELNRRMNETLESIARAVFKSWFIDFDPVILKNQGREPIGIDAETAAMFPGELENSIIGQIPKGWEVRPLPELIELNPTRNLTKGEMSPYLDMSNMPVRGHRALQWIYRPFGSGTKFLNGDTLLARITPCLENGKTAFVDFLEDGQVGWGSTEYIVLHPKNPLPPEYGYYLARSEPLREHAIINMTGTSGRQRTPVSCLDNFFIVNPPPSIARRFGEIVSSLIAKIRKNDEESRTLTSLRDSLLPRLISGRLRIPDAERILQDTI